LEPTGSTRRFPLKKPPKSYKVSTESREAELKPSQQLGKATHPLTSSRLSTPHRHPAKIYLTAPNHSDNRAKLEADPDRTKTSQAPEAKSYNLKTGVLQQIINLQFLPPWEPNHAIWYTPPGSPILASEPPPQLFLDLDFSAKLPNY
jgi:hypothetical protein